MWTEEKLDELLTTPSSAMVQDMTKIDGDIMVLGAGGKMGPTLCLMAKRAIHAAGIDKRVIAVSRFTDPSVSEMLHAGGVETISCDLLDPAQLQALPAVKNVIFMAGRKFGTDGAEWQTWAMNASLPAFTAQKFKDSRIVVFSSGNVYPLADISSGGSIETDAPGPIGEYTMSCLARERAFEYASNTFGTKVLIFRLNFAVDLRYGVLHDIAERILRDEPVSLTTPLFNCIWQGSANEYAVRSLLHADSPMKILNVTGPETVSVKWAATKLGEYLGKAPTFAGEPSGSAYLNNASEAMTLFGYPAVPMQTLVQWQAEWILSGGRSLGKPTHFEERKGSY